MRAFLLIVSLMAVRGTPADRTLPSQLSSLDYNYQNDGPLDEYGNPTDYPDYKEDATEDLTSRGSEDISEEVTVNSDVPNFISQGGERFGELGGTVQLSCQVNQLGGRDMLWLKENGNKNPDQLYIVGRKVVDDDDITMKHLDGGEGTVLVISNLQEKHSGNYTCRVADQKVPKWLNFHLSIIHKQSDIPAGQLTSSSCQKLPFYSLVLGLAVIVTASKLL